MQDVLRKQSSQDNDSAISLPLMALILLFLVFMSSCQKKEDPKNCTTLKQDAATIVTCPDGTTSVVSDGSKGEQGDKGETGATGADGSKGETGETGATGATGSSGSNGQNGNDGRDGTDATPITITQFCPGNVNYPNVFPEVGLCINSKIYAVFWDRGQAFMAEVPPGAYRSTSTSLACNFTVQSNCIISH